MTYSHICRYLSAPSSPKGKADCALVWNLAIQRLQLSHFQDSSSRNIVIGGPLSGKTVAEMVSLTLSKCQKTVGTLFQQEHDLWNEDIRLFLLIDGQPLPKAEFSEYANRFIELLRNLEKEVHQTLDNDQRRCLFAAYVFSQKKCDFCVLDDTQNEYIEYSFGTVADLFHPTFVAFTGSTEPDSPDNLFSEASVSHYIRPGTVEVVSNLQGKLLFERIISACSSCSSRLTLPLRTQLTWEYQALNQARLSYRDDQSFILPSSSYCDWLSAILAYEMILILERHHADVHSAFFEQCLSLVRYNHHFRILSVHPLIILARIGASSEIKPTINSLQLCPNYGTIKGSLIICEESALHLLKDCQFDGDSIEFQGFPAFQNATTIPQQYRLEDAALEGVFSNKQNAYLFLGNLHFIKRIESAFHRSKS